MIVLPALVIAVDHPSTDFAMWRWIRVGFSIRVLYSSHEATANKRVVSEKLVHSVRAMGKWLARGDNMHTFGSHPLKRRQHVRIGAQLQDGSSARLASQFCIE